MQYNTIQYNTIQYNTIQYNTIQYNTIQYNTIQHNTIQQYEIFLGYVYKIMKNICKTYNWKRFLYYDKRSTWRPLTVWIPVYPSEVKWASAKPTIRLVRPAKTQIRLRRCVVWSVLADHTCPLQPLGYPKRAKREPLPYWVDVQADLSLCWLHRSFCRFWCALAHIKWIVKPELSNYLWESQKV